MLHVLHVLHVEHASATRHGARLHCRTVYNSGSHASQLFAAGGRRAELDALLADGVPWENYKSRVTRATGDKARQHATPSRGV